MRHTRLRARVRPLFLNPPATLDNRVLLEKVTIKRGWTLIVHAAATREVPCCSWIWATPIIYLLPNIVYQQVTVITRPQSKAPLHVTEMLFQRARIRDHLIGLAAERLPLRLIELYCKDK